LDLWSEWEMLCKIELTTGDNVPMRMLREHFNRGIGFAKIPEFDGIIITRTDK
jgi:hypothetical protein